MPDVGHGSFGFVSVLLHQEVLADEVVVYL